MKLRKYENKNLIIIVSLIFILVEIIFFILLYTNKEYKYKKLTGIVMKDDLLIVVINKEDKKLLNSNSHIYLNTKKQNYEIIDDRGAIIKKDNEKFYELLIKIKFDKKYKTNDVIDFTIKTEKMRLIEMFKTIWEGE